MLKKLGRNKRIFNPKVMHMSSLMASAVNLPPLPESVDWTKGVEDFGMMLNDQLGCCTIAGFYHARQIWSMNSGVEITEADDELPAV